MLTIYRFADEYAFLSNFYPSRVLLDGVIYPTVEHAYQAAKTISPSERDSVLFSGSPGRAKQAGKRVKIREGWDDMKLSVMRDLLIQKFTHDNLKALLVATGGARLVEGNSWGYRYWGMCDGVGHNHLGELLMGVRGLCK